MPLDKNTRAMVAGIFGKCEVGILCKKCKNVLVTKSVDDLLVAADDGDLLKFGQTVIPSIISHKCEGLPVKTVD